MVNLFRRKVVKVTGLSSYDREALESRKEFQPKDSAMDMATAMGIEILTEEQY